MMKRLSFSAILLIGFAFPVAGNALDDGPKRSRTSYTYNQSKSVAPREWKNADIKLRIGDRLIIKLNPNVREIELPNSYLPLSTVANPGSARGGGACFPAPQSHLPVLSPLSGLPVTYSYTPVARHPDFDPKRVGGTKRSNQVVFLASSVGTECLQISRFVNAGVASTTAFATIRVKVFGPKSNNQAKNTPQIVTIKTLPKQVVALKNKLSANPNDNDAWNDIFKLTTNQFPVLDTIYEDYDRILATANLVDQMADEFVKHVNQLDSVTYVQFNAMRLSRSPAIEEYLDNWTRESLSKKFSNLSKPNTAAMAFGAVAGKNAIDRLRAMHDKQMCTPQYMAEALYLATKDEYLDSINIKNPSIRVSVDDWQKWLLSKYKINASF